MKHFIFFSNFLILFFISISNTNAQSILKLLRFDDNFNHLKDKKIKENFDKLKYIKLSQNNYISFGGELREQIQYFDNINFGDVPPTFKTTSTYQLNHRLMFHTNVEIGNNLRFFIQGNNTLKLINQNPDAPEIDENKLSLHQAFADIKLNNWMIRIGKQEMFYGNHRLITVREGPNTRKSFTGLIIKHHYKQDFIDFFATSPSISKPDIFDDENFKELFMGFYASHFFKDQNIGLDYFVNNFQSKLRQYNYQNGTENRNTIGVRLFSNNNKVNYEIEGAYQWGKFDNLKISAYNIYTDFSSTIFPKTKGKMGFAINLASGDKNKDDNELNTYNLLFAKPAYGLAVPIGSTNIISLSPYFKINPIQKFSLLAQTFFLSRNSNQDGTYSPGMIQNRPSTSILYKNNQKKLGTLFLIETNYQYSNNLSVALDISYFNASDYPISTGNGKNITYVSLKTSFKF